MRQQPNKRGFTLIEVLFVVMIIVLLVSLLVPSVTGAKRAAANSKSAANLRQLDVAVQQYQTSPDSGGYYPGQPDFAIYQGPTDPNTIQVQYPYENPNLANDRNGFKTGSATLAFFLLKGTYQNVESYKKGDITYLRTKNSSDSLLQFANDGLFEFQSLPGEAPCISDLNAEPRPILYFPARINGIYVGDAFVYDDNSAYTTGAGEDEWKFRKSIVDYRQTSMTKEAVAALNPTNPGTDRDTLNGLKAVNAGKFLLIGAGPDRIYFTEDDIKNY